MDDIKPEHEGDPGARFFYGNPLKLMCLCRSGDVEQRTGFARSDESALLIIDAPAGRTSAPPARILNELADSFLQSEACKDGIHRACDLLPVRRGEACGFESPENSGGQTEYSGDHNNGTASHEYLGIIVSHSQRFSGRGVRQLQICSTGIMNQGIAMDDPPAVDGVFREWGYALLGPLERREKPACRHGCGIVPQHDTQHSYGVL
jgi:hypothetical protein